MSGERKSLTVDERWKAVSDELDRLMGQFAHFESTEVMQYLKVNRDVLRKMSPEECGEAAYLLQQESIYLQLLLNELRTKMDWAKYNVDRIVAQEIRQFDRWTPNEYKRHLVIQSNTAAQQYQRMFNKAERLFTRLNFIPTQLKSQAETLLRYASTKERQNYGNST